MMSKMEARDNFSNKKRKIQRESHREQRHPENFAQHNAINENYNGKTPDPKFFQKENIYFQLVFSSITSKTA